MLGVVDVDQVGARDALVFGELELEPCAAPAFVLSFDQEIAERAVVALSCAADAGAAVDLVRGTEIEIGSGGVRRVERDRDSGGEGVRLESADENAGVFVGERHVGAGEIGAPNASRWKVSVSQKTGVMVPCASVRFSRPKPARYRCGCPA